MATEVHITVSPLLLNSLDSIAVNLGAIATAISDSAPLDQSAEICDLGTSIERGLSDLANSVSQLEIGS